LLISALLSSYFLFLRPILSQHPILQDHPCSSRREIKFPVHTVHFWATICLFVRVGLSQLVQWLLYKLVGRGIGVIFPARDIYILHNVQTGSGAHLASYTMGTGGCFHKGNAVGRVKLTTHLHLRLVSRLRKPGAINPLPHSPSRRGAQFIKPKDKFIFTLFMFLCKRQGGEGFSTTWQKIF
jgi:hypothetical protein